MSLFQILHKFLMFDVLVPANRSAVITQAFLCANQITVCVKFLEKTVEMEATTGCLITARQCFFERILWCLARLKATVKSANDHVLTGIAEPDNFITLLDRTLDILSGFIGIEGDNSNTNKAELRAELMMESREIRDTIEQLLSHALAFASIALESDKNPITMLSQGVLKVALEFEEEFSLSQPGKKSNESTQRIKVIELENALYSLETYVNNALLRLVFEVFHVMDTNIVGNLLKVEGAAALEREIEKFDLIVDRLIQIGHFAIWYSRDDHKISSTVRSSLASIESLDCYLIPAITSKTDPSIDIFENHFDVEAKSLQLHVQQIIDTSAFCSTLIDLLNESIAANRKDFNRDSLTSLVKRANILLQHFQINAKNLKLTSDKVTKFYFHDFKLILTECDAILNFPEVIDDVERRTLKRFSILSSTTRKLQTAIKNQQKIGNDENEKGVKNILKPTDFPSKCSDYFNTIRPSALGSILYESRRSIKVSAKPNASRIINSTVRRSKKKRHSLRIVIFKKQHDLDVEELWNKDEETMDLQITEILDKLTDLSTTLTHKAV